MHVEEAHLHHARVCTMQVRRMQARRVQARRVRMCTCVGVPWVHAQRACAQRQLAQRQLACAAYLTLLHELAVNPQRVPEEHEEARGHHTDARDEGTHALIMQVVLVQRDLC